MAVWPHHTAGERLSWLINQIDQSPDRERKQAGPELLTCCDFTLVSLSASLMTCIYKTLLKQEGSAAFTLSQNNQEKQHYYYLPVVRQQLRQHPENMKNKLSCAVCLRT